MTAPETLRPSTPEAVLKTPEVSDILPNDLREKAQELYAHFSQKDTSLLPPETQQFVDEQLKKLQDFLDPENFLKSLVDTSLENTQNDPEMIETVHEAESDYKKSTAETLQSVSGMFEKLLEKIPNIKESFLSLVTPLLDAVKNNSSLAFASIAGALAAKGNMTRMLAMMPFLGKVGADAFPDQIESVMKWMGIDTWFRDAKEWGLKTILQLVLHVDFKNPGLIDSTIINAAESVTNVDLDGDKEEYDTKKTESKKEPGSNFSFLEHLSKIFAK